MMNDKRELLRSLRIEPDQRRDEASAPPRRRPPLTLVSVLLLLVGGGAYMLGRASAPEPAAPLVSRPSPSVTGAAAPAAASPAAPAATRASGLIASGYVVARRTATVSAEITGRVQDVLVDDGMVVRQGQEVARLDDTLARIDLELSKARVASAAAQIDALTADLKDAERILQRISSLSRAANASEAELTRAQARADTLRAQIKGARADLEVARITVERQAETVDRHIIRAPFDGVVIDKNAQPGEIISPMSSGGFTRTGVCTLVDMNSLEVEVDVNEANIGRVRPGQPVEAVLDAYPDWKIKASVIAIIPTANRDKATIKVRIGLAETDPRVLPEMGAKVTFIES
ncbi:MULTISPECIES: efflux RND transporter periplasmic adaptor subunit [unclassified Azospirillum]|uniref:efflux RND transporter periplasmic adaptor subunit n=1 Tax=unclassified Azospirillum TaxID=2630922 RepID=UPI001FCDAC24|nr:MULTISPECIES: efflux RND transporter periplasmic adaptor subunit [unclassified Azospirillum]